MAGEKNIGARITLGGEKEYRKAISNIKTAQAQLRSEYKLLATQYKDSQNSMEALLKKQDLLTRQYDASKEKVEACKKAVAAYTQQQAKATEKVSRLETEYKDAEKALSQMKQAYGENSQEAKDQEKALEAIGKQLQRAQSDYTAAGTKVSTWTSALNYATEENIRLDQELKTNQRYIQEAKNNVDHTATSIDEYGNEVKEASDETTTFGEVLKANLASQAIIAGVKALASAITSAAGACIDAGKAFEASMSNVKALSGATQQELETLTQAARNAGENTVFSASEAADALGYMALAGWKTNEMVSGLEPVLNLAAAANTDLARTSDIVTDYLTAFGLTAQDAGKFADQMAYAMANSNTNVEQLGEAYKSCAATAHSMGVSVEEVTAVLATMANAGVKGGEAGTALGTIMTRLATDTKDCVTELKAYGVKVYDAYGNMNSLSSILTGMSGIWDNLTDSQQANLAKTVAGVNHFSKLQTIMGGLSQEVKEGGKSFEDYRDMLKICDGTAQEMAATMQDNLQGKLKTLESALESLRISTYNVFDDSLKDGVEAATSAIRRLNESVSKGSLNISLSRLSKSLGEFTEKALDAGEKALPGMIDALAWVIDHSGTIVTTVGTVIAAQTAYKVAVEAATIAQQLQNAVLMANPAGLVVAGVVALTGALIALESVTDDQTEALEQEYKETQKVIDSNREFNDSIREGAQERARFKESTEADAAVARTLVGRLKALQAVSDGSTESMTKQRMVVDQLNEAMPGLNLAIDKQTGELNMSTDAILKNVDALTRQAKAEAASEDVARIAKERYAAEKQLYELEKQKAIAADKLAEAQAQAAKEAREYNRITEETQAAASFAEGALEELNAQIDATKESTQALSEEYERTEQFLEETEALEAATEAVEGYGDAAEDAGDKVSGMSESAIEAFNNMYDTVVEAVGKSLDVFEEFDQKTTVSKEKLLENMQSQIDGITKWADNLEELGRRGIDKGLLAHLSEMGPSGAAYVAAFTEMTDKELQEAGEKFGEAMKLPSDVAERIAETYMMAGSSAVQSTVEGMEENTEAVKNATSQVAGEMLDTMDEELKSDGTTSEAMLEKGETASKSVGAGIEDGSEDAVDATEALVWDVIETAGQLEEYDWASIGRNLTDSMATAIREGKSGVVNAIVELCTETVQAAKDEMEIHSPSRKFKWIGEMTAKGFNEGIQDNLVDVGAMIEAASPRMNNSPEVLGNASTPEVLGKVSDLIAADLAAALDNITIEVNNVVQMEADLNRLFRAVMKENDKEIKRGARGL